MTNTANPTQQEIVAALGQELLDAAFAYEQYGERLKEKLDIIDYYGEHPETPPREVINELGGIDGLLDTVLEKERLVSARGRALDAYVTARRLVEAPSGLVAESASA